MKQLINKIFEKIETAMREAGVCLNNDYDTCGERCENPMDCGAYQRYVLGQEYAQEIREFNKLRGNQ